MKVAIYARVSSDKQREREHGALQRARARTKWMIIPRGVDRFLG